MSDYQNIFENIFTDPRYVSNLDWGEAREGHPEATIRAHIAEIELNLERLRPRLTEIDYWKLKVLVHTHDTFKVNRSREWQFPIPTATLQSPALF